MIKRLIQRQSIESGFLVGSKELLTPSPPSKVRTSDLSTQPKVFCLTYAALILMNVIQVVKARHLSKQLRSLTQKVRDLHPIAELHRKTIQ